MGCTRARELCSGSRTAVSCRHANVAAVVTFRVQVILPHAERIGIPFASQGKYEFLVRGPSSSARVPRRSCLKYRSMLEFGHTLCLYKSCKKYMKHCCYHQVRCSKDC